MHNIPNLISVVRLLLVPLTVWLIISEAYGWAFLTFMAAGISDGVDGYLARRFDWRTRLGAYLDPLADKALLVSVFVTLGFLKLIPAWLVLLVVSRDALIVGAVLLSRLMDHPVHVHPLMVSKVNTVAQIMFAVAVLGVAALGKPLESLVDYGSIPVALLTALSGAAYLASWLRHMAEHPEGKNQP
ncbi:CDP-alcohol phosphatidyltransferase family protein [Aestuariivirga litoralis]|uniref:CDP-diacylglycerol--glycerol-3-phosphate 3-phosphatidyltransferase n=1 Tax=Aestuariivirga litoralis TaxID=2650924 RepID=A0A2W2B5K7_9HYPH|nr:CDP-alcohol phosphatidyltransferase family protein [Aestuariivirga litoralis]PZF75408.1 CDP-alcohol phosphatidyltransferase family protein [Aestuariivirga litoralis]